MTDEQIEFFLSTREKSKKFGFNFHNLTVGIKAAELVGLNDQTQIDAAAKLLAERIGETIFVEVTNDPRMKADAAIWSNTPWSERVGEVEFVDNPNA